MTEEQEQIYQHTITNLLRKVDKRDETIHQLRMEIVKLRKQRATEKEDECNGIVSHRE